MEIILESEAVKYQEKGEGLTSRRIVGKLKAADISEKNPASVQLMSGSITRYRFVKDVDSAFDKLQKRINT